MINRISGECLCGSVKFSVSEQFDSFYICHCEQCQKISGSAFAANLFTTTDNITWVAGEKLINTYRHPTRDFSTSFCKNCGSGLPYVNKSGTSLVIPAGTLRGPLSTSPQAQIFVDECPNWLPSALSAKQFKRFAT